MLKQAIRVLLMLPLAFAAFHTAARVVRRFYKFPMPQFLANTIDNPLRRRLQPPDATAARHGVEPGMVVLEIGPGNGRYSVAAARRAEPGGRLVTVDIEPRMIERVRRRADAKGVTNIEGRVAGAHELPFPPGTFDLAYMIAVTGEIPDPVRALAEVRRVLKPDGRLACSEIFVDPDYPRAATLARWAAAAGFRVERKIGGVLYYTLILAPL